MTETPKLKTRFGDVFIFTLLREDEAIGISGATSATSFWCPFILARREVLFKK